MKILVTGGAGYIGSILVPELLELGHRVTVLDNLIYNNGLSLAACCVYSNFDLVVGDVRSTAVLATMASLGFDAVIALAAIVGAPACDRDDTAAVTINYGAIDLLCRSFPSKTRILYPNTNSGYGFNDGMCTENTPVHPLSTYAVTKTAGEKSVLAAGGVSLRLATVFGMSPRMRLDLMVNEFVLRALRDRSIMLYEPHFRRNFVHVRDVAAAFIFALNNYDEMSGQIYNVGQDSANMTKMQLCERIAKFRSFIIKEIPGRDPDQRNYEVSNAKIMKLGFRPEYLIDDGIRELLVGLRGVPQHDHGNV